ncbi:MAG: hypothetical protein GX552_11430 [Chloroflexi bacterium]|nr:hypothetical protein [Chloroflexota bacterium]
MSDDGGRSWSAAEPIFGNLLGVSGWDTMASDPYGSVFWVGTLRYPQAVYASVLRDGTWREPPRPLITQAFHLGLAGAHFPHLVVSRGNQLHLVLVEGDGGPLWYLHGQSDLPKDATQPTPWPRVVQMASPSPTPEATSDITTPISEEEPGQSVQLGVSLNPVVWAIAPVLLVLAIVFKVFRQRTR